MTLSTSTLLLLLEAGAAVIGKTMVQEATKSAYNKVKDKFLELFGRRGADQLTAIEANPSDAAARRKLNEIVASLTDTEQKQLAPLAAALVAAFKEDTAAQIAAEEMAAIRLDVTGENIVIQRVEGASIMDIKAEASKDFIFTDIKMKGPTDPGN